MNLQRRIQRKIELETRRLTASLRSLPDFLIIGAQKAGTSSLFSYLDMHPKITSAYVKEVRFFDENYDKGINWYRGHFPMVAGEQSDQYFFEASPNYMVFPHTAKRVANHLPNIKLIASLRHPIHMAYSHYSMNLRRPNVDESLSFENAIRAESERLKNTLSAVNDPKIGYSERYAHYSYLARGRYWEQLKLWFDVFPQEQIKIVQAEQLFEDTTEVYSDVLNFIGAKQWIPPSFGAANSSGASQSVRSKIGDALYDELIDYFRPHNEDLFNNIGVRFDWN